MLAHNDNTPAPVVHSAPVALSAPAITQQPAPPRPAAFDAMLMKYLPGLTKQASKLGFKGEAREDIVTDTIIYCLKNWQSYRVGVSEWAYLRFAMLSVVKSKRSVDSHRMKFVDVPDDWFSGRISTPAPQEHYVELSQTLAKLSGRGGDVLMRRVMTDDTLNDVSRDYGLSIEGTRQIEVRARRQLAEACGRVAA